jgi:hypothetical protein
MSRHIDLLIASPPALNFPQLVGVQDEHGQPVTVGQWLAPDDGCMFWRYRLTPAELLMYMIADTEQPLVAHGEVQIEAPINRVPRPTNRGVSARQALKDRVASAKPRLPGATTAAASPESDPLATEKCPSCYKPFNPSLHQLIDCGACGEPKCTANCFGNMAEPCLDCQALKAEPDDGGFDEASAPPLAEVKNPALRAKMAEESAGATRAVGSRLFDNTFHGKGGDNAAEEDED